jgi:hypothetical protein
MRTAMFSWESLQFHSVGGIAAHVTELVEIRSVEMRDHR